MSEKRKYVSDFGKFVLSNRESRGWSREELAQKVGCSLSTIHSVETGFTYKLSKRFKKRICELFNVSDSDLAALGFINESKPVLTPFASFMLEERKKRGMTPAEFANLTGCSIQSIFLLEKGKIFAPHRKRWLKICETLGIEISRVIELSRETSEHIKKISCQDNVKNVKGIHNKNRVSPFGLLLLEKRISMQMTRKDVAQMLDLCEGTIKALESGKIASLSIAHWQKICSTFGVTIEQLLEAYQKGLSTELDEQESLDKALTDNDEPSVAQLSNEIDSLLTRFKHDVEILIERWSHDS